MQKITDNTMQVSQPALKKAFKYYSCFYVCSIVLTNGLGLRKNRR